MKPFVGKSLIVCVVLTACFHPSAFTKGDEVKPPALVNVDDLLSSDETVRRLYLSKLFDQYVTLSNELRTVLADAITKYPNDRSYGSPLHSAILAVQGWRVLRADTQLLSIIDYRLDPFSVPDGSVIGGCDYFPAAVALVTLRVDTKAVLDAIKASAGDWQLPLLTWVLLHRTHTPDEARDLLDDAMKTGNEAGRARLRRSIELLARGEGLLDLRRLSAESNHGQLAPWIR